jgi:hypothetical protein
VVDAVEFDDPSVRREVLPRGALALGVDHSVGAAEDHERVEAAL